METRIFSLFLELQKRQLISQAAPAVDAHFLEILRRGRVESVTPTALLERWGVVWERELTEAETKWLRRKVRRIHEADVAAVPAAATDWGNLPSLANLTDQLPPSVTDAFQSVLASVQASAASAAPPEEVMARTIQQVEHEFRTKLEQKEITEADVLATAKVLQEHLLTFKNKLPSEFGTMIDLLHECISDYMKQGAADTPAGSAPIASGDMADILSQFMAFAKDAQGGRMRSAHPFIKSMMSKLTRTMSHKLGSKKMKLTQQDKLRMLWERRQKAQLPNPS